MQVNPVPQRRDAHRFQRVLVQQQQPLSVDVVGEKQIGVLHQICVVVTFQRDMAGLVPHV